MKLLVYSALSYLCMPGNLSVWTLKALHLGLKLLVHEALRYGAAWQSVGVDP